MMDVPVRRRTNSLKGTSAKSNTKQALPAPAHRPTGFLNLLQSFVNDCRVRNLSSRSVSFYEECMLLMQKSFVSRDLPFDVLSITAKEIKHQYVGHMLARGLASNTVNGRIKACKAFFKYLYEEELIADNVAEQLRLVKGEKKMIQTFTKEQAITLLNQPDRDTFTGFRDYTIMMVMLETGIRVGELVNLKTSDIFLKEMEIRISRGKGGKARRVPIQRTCVKLLKQYLDERGHVEDDALFINIDGEPLRIRTIQDNIRVYGKQARLSGVRVSPHTFRHTMAKFYILNGGDVFTLQQILGHSTLDMVRYYVELFSKDIREQHQKYSPVENMRR